MPGVTSLLFEYNYVSNFNRRHANEADTAWMKSMTSPTNVYCYNTFNGGGDVPGIWLDTGDSITASTAICS